MANENRCPKCGDLLTDFNRGGELVFDCHYDKKDCRIKELERQLEEANDSIHAMHSDCSGFVVQIGSLESERDTLRSALIQRNAQLGVACLRHDLIHALECAGCYREIQSELDAALAQVAVQNGAIIVLRGALEYLAPRIRGELHPDHPEVVVLEGALDPAILGNTSATAQQFVERIKREALESARKKGAEHAE